MTAKCPACHARTILAVAPTTHIVMSVGPRAAIGAPYGTSFLISLDARAMCNKRGCNWVGTVGETQRKDNE